MNGKPDLYRKSPLKRPDIFPQKDNGIYFLNMSILDTFFHKHFGPIILKENSDAEEFIFRMKDLSAKASGSLKGKIDAQIAAAEAGLAGEKQILFHLKNSGIDMVVMHDLCLEREGLFAQIDFLVMTRKHTFVIECKNLYGNIEIDEKGNFIRHKGYGKFTRKEGMESPVTQNERHLNLLKNIRLDFKNGSIQKARFDRKFSNFYRSLIVLANPKTIVNDKHAPQEIRNIVIRADQLAAHIKKTDADDHDTYPSNEAELRQIAEEILSYNKKKKSDCARKYEELLTKEFSNAKAEKTAPTNFSHGGQISNSETAKIRTEDTPKNERNCPRCGGKLVLRTAKKGANAGNSFWGCSNFPKCRYVEAENSNT